MSDSLQPYDTDHRIIQARILECLPFPSLGDLPNSRIEPRSPALQADSFPTEPQEKPKNTGVDSLSLLQWIFLTQELNWGLLHCRQILYQLSHKGSPRIPEWAAYPFSSRSSRPRNWTRVSCTAGGFFTNWATSVNTYCWLSGRINVFYLDIYSSLAH